MEMKDISNNWNEQTVENIKENFKKLSGIKNDIIQDVMSADPNDYNLHLNGLKKPSKVTDTRNLNDYGINFLANNNALINSAWVYAATSGKVSFGLATQAVAGIATGTIKLIECDLKAGWNKVILNFPIEQGVHYTMFKRNLSESINLAAQTISGWNTYNFIENGLDFKAGKYLTDTRTYTAYSPFFEIELITNIAQIYKIMNDSVKPAPQFHMGENPPTESQFWFRPIGG